MISRSNKSNYVKIEQIIGCKWSVSVLMAIKNGKKRPGILEKSIEGISTKVLTERLKKLTNFGIIEKHSFNEIPPRTEYTITKQGNKLASIIEQIQELEEEL
jgi:DNA-binding HxlR family transcriptional regulator